MKIVISPAKSLELNRQLPTRRYTQPQFFTEAVKINKKLSSFSRKQLEEIMSISNRLADLNYSRYQIFQKEQNPKNARPAVYMFNGDVYNGLDAYSMPSKKIDALQDSLRILSAMYGILKPLDLIQPYRLEMGIPLSMGKNKNLYELWQEKITASLNKELKEGELFLNLASHEYFKAIDKKRLKTEIISPVFKDFKNGQLKIISFYAKKARGAMVRYLIDQNISKFEGLKGFNYERYGFSEQCTTKESEPVFIR